LLDRGFSLEEAAAIRGLESSTIIRHATLMARKGHPIALQRCLSAETIDQWENLHDRGEQTAPAGADEGIWGLFLACRASIAQPTNPGSKLESGGV
jgi:ATP-dependent DNA helicase RecQ